MSHLLEVPDDIYKHAQKIATRTTQPVEQVLIEQLRLLTLLPEDEQAELNALRHLSDDVLWMIAAEQMPAQVNERMQALMSRNNLGTITDEERTELAALVERGNRLMVRKAEASGILMERGHTFTQADYQHKDE